MAVGPCILLTMLVYASVYTKGPVYLVYASVSSVYPIVYTASVRPVYTGYTALGSE